MQRRRRAAFIVRRFELGPLLTPGLLLGGVVGFLPSLVAAFATMRAISAVRQIMENARHVNKTIPLVNQLVSFDFIDLLGLTSHFRRLAFVDDHAWLFGIALFVFLLLLSALSFCLSALAAAMVYNGFSRTVGGLRVELDEIRLER